MQKPNLNTLMQNAIIYLFNSHGTDWVHQNCNHKFEDFADLPDSIKNEFPDWSNVDGFDFLKQDSDTTTAVKKQLHILFNAKLYDMVLYIWANNLQIYSELSLEAKEKAYKNWLSCYDGDNPMGENNKLDGVTKELAKLGVSMTFFESGDFDVKLQNLHFDRATSPLANLNDEDTIVVIMTVFKNSDDECVRLYGEALADDYRERRDLFRSMEKALVQTKFDYAYKKLFEKHKHSFLYEQDGGRVLYRFSDLVDIHKPF